MLAKLLPKKADFFALFSRHAALAVEAARALEGLLDRLGSAEAESGRIREIEHQADAICQETMETLHRTFVTPIERSDIHELAGRLDDIVDHVESAGQRLWLYDIHQATPEMRQMAAFLRQATEAVRETVDALADRRHAARIREHCAKVKAVEKENDRLLRRATAKLFREERDAVALIKWKEIYDTMEAAVDLCEDVANVVEGVVLENA
jgi:predicted phosphate transport protein (TIGR00153 family)